jgi:site-specific recombinase XerD
MYEALDRYLEYLHGARNASRYTIRNYGHEIRQALDFFAARGARRWSDVERPLLRQYLAWLASDEAMGYAPGSVARRVSELRAFGSYLEDSGIVDHNPFQALRPPRTPDRLPVVLSRREVTELLDAPPVDGPAGVRDRAILEVLYGSGVRVSELAGLGVADYDARERTLRVTGKGDRERICLLGQPGSRALDRYIAKVRPELAARAKRPSRSLFLNQRGGGLSARSVQRMLRRYGRAAGLRTPVTPHILRHTFATHLTSGGADMRVVQELLGHESLATTQVYTHVSRAHLRASYLAAHPRAAGSSAPDPTEE